MSGSSTLTLRPGFALSGKTHSLLGFANTLPELDEVSLFPDGVEEVEVEAVGKGVGAARGVEDAVEEGRRTIGGAG